jgi:hypothetical protein
MTKKLDRAGGRMEKIDSLGSMQKVIDLLLQKGGMRRIDARRVALVEFGKDRTEFAIDSDLLG